MSLESQIGLPEPHDGERRLTGRSTHDGMEQAICGLQLLKLGRICDHVAILASPPMALEGSRTAGPTIPTHLLRLVAKHSFTVAHKVEFSGGWIVYD